MADSAVQLVINLLNALINERSLLVGLKDDITAINSKLQNMVAFLKSAEEIAEEDLQVKEWVKQVRNLAYEIEDVIEEYQLSQKGSSWDKFMQICSMDSRNMAVTIKSLLEQATEICERKNHYRLNKCVAVPGQCSSQLNSSSMGMAEDFELVGIETPKEELIELMRLKEFDLRTSTITVLGRRGLGKTTVVRSVYMDTVVCDNFLFRAWVSVSRYSNDLDMLRSIAKQLYETGREARERYKRAGMKCFFGNDIDALAPVQVDQLVEDSLSLLLRSFLEERRYMVVFDDVQDIKLKDLVCVLPSNTKGSKILITTCCENVGCAFLEGTSDATYKLKPLPPQMAWKLFCKKTFQIHDGTCPRWLESHAREVFDKCEGIPIMILALGCFLSINPDDLEVWKKVHHNLAYYLENNTYLTDIHKILTQSYHRLPHNLKPCFLYFGLFPKGYHVGKMRLIRLWIAEGFITEGSGLTLEEVAEENINQLLGLRLVEIGCKDSTESPKTLRVHEFYHVVILSKLEKLNFCRVVSTEYSNNPIEKHRRLSIHNDDPCDVLKKSVTESNSNFRCLLIEPAERLYPMVINKRFLMNNLRLLKVLDLWNAPNNNDIPKVVGELLNLRYLGLRNTGVKMLPCSIGKLQDLQTLDLKQSHIHKLPNEINELHKLRHLLSYRYDYDVAIHRHVQIVRGVIIPEGVLGNFEELQKLTFIDVSHKSKVIKELGNLKQLRKLGIMGLKFEDGVNLCDAITKMNSLQALSVYSKNLIEEIDLQHLKSPPSLKRLYLNGPLKCFPTWILELHSLVKVRMRWSRLQNSDPLENLHKLPNLVELQLLDAYDGSFLEIREVGFQKLKVLNLLDLRNLESLLINKGALPVLEELSIGKSINLQVPSGIQYLRRLKLLNFFNMPHCFSNSIRPGEQFFWVVEHVPTVNFQIKGDNDRLWRTYTLR